MPIVRHVNVGSSPFASVILNKRSYPDRIKVQAKVDDFIRKFVDEYNKSPEQVAAFVRDLVSIYSDELVASHIVEEDILYLFLDAVSPEVKSRFIYAPHCSKAH